MLRSSIERPYKYTLLRNNYPIYSSDYLDHIKDWKNKDEQKKRKNFYPTILFIYETKENY